MPQWDGRDRDVQRGGTPGARSAQLPAPAPGKRTLAEQEDSAEPSSSPVQRKPAGDAPSPAPSNAPDQLAHLLAEPWSSGRLSLRPDAVVAYLETLDMQRMLDELSDAIACGYGRQLEARCSVSPRLLAAVYAAELARIAPITPVHPALARAGAALDQVSSDQQLQVLSWMLHRRGVSIEATQLVEGVVAMREQRDNQAAPAEVGAGAGSRAPSQDADGVAGAPSHDAAGLGPTAGATMPPSVEPGPWQPPGNQWPGFYIGNEAHKRIAQEYRAAHIGEEVRTNYSSMSSILQVLGRLGHTANPDALNEPELDMMPDIVNLTQLHLYEIKPATAQARGAAKAALYVGLFGRAGIAMQLGPLGEPGTEGGIPAPGGVYMFSCVQPGVITYQYQRGRLVPVPFPVGERSRVRRWRFELRPLTREEQQAAVTLTLGSALLLILMIALAPIGA